MQDMQPFLPELRKRGTLIELAVLAVVIALWSALIVAAPPSRVKTVTWIPAETTLRSSRGGIAPAALASNTSPNGAQPSCQGVSPGPSWACAPDGKWELASFVGNTSGAGAGG